MEDCKNTLKPSPNGSSIFSSRVTWDGGALCIDNKPINGRDLNYVMSALAKAICDISGDAFIYQGDDVDCGALNLATAGDTIEDILNKVCLRIDTIGQFFNIVGPNSDGDIYNVTINGIANSPGLAGDVTFFSDRIGCSDDIIITVDSPDGITFAGASTTLIIPGDESVGLTDWEHPTGLPVGSYNATLTWSACGINKVQNITFNLS